MPAARAAGAADRARSPTTATRSSRATPSLLIVEDDPHYARDPRGPRARQGLQGAGRDAGRRCARRSRSSTSRRRSRSTSSCPTCSAGRCSASSSRTRRRGTSRCRSSRSTRIASTAWRAAPSPSSPSRPPPKGLEAALDAHQGLRRSRAASACWSSRTTPAEQMSITRAARPRRHRDRRRPAPAPRRSTTLRRAAVRLRRARPAPARHVGLRGAGAASATTRRCPTCRSWSSPAASSRPRRTRSCTRMARSVVVKGVESPERLLDETALFLHRVVADLPAEKQRMLERLHRSDEDLVGQHGAGGRRRRAQHLRAVAACSSGAACSVLTATTGREAIELLEIDAGRRDRADGHHDAGDGRLPDDAGASARSRRSAACRSSRSPPRP